MKLSLRKRLGWIHAKGGRVLRVVMPHAVPTSTWHEAGATGRNLDGTTLPQRFPNGEETVTCATGDLAIEILNVKTAKVLGYAYLSGAAIQLHRYDRTPPQWFEVARAERAVLERPNPTGSPEQAAHYVAWAMRMKYGPADIYAFEFFADGERDAHGAGEFVRQLWNYAAADDPDESTAGAPLLDIGEKLHQHSHTMAILNYDRRSRGGALALHFQPASAASDFMATAFQIGLVLSSLP